VEGQVATAAWPCRFFFIIIIFILQPTLFILKLCFFSFRLVSQLNPFPGMKHLDVAGGTGIPIPWLLSAVL
jgi:hypothetical protein